MSSRNERRDENEASFEGVLDLGSVPPPPGAVGPDVHAARTAVAALPTSLLEELRRAKATENGEASRTRRQEKFELPPKAVRGESFTNEAPTAPGKDSMRLLRPLAPDVNEVPPSSAKDDLVAAVTAALASAKEEDLSCSPPPAPSPPAPAAAPMAAAASAPDAIVRTPPMAVPVRIATPIATPAPMFAALDGDAQPAPVVVRTPFLIALIIVTGIVFVLGTIAFAEHFLVPH